MNKLLDVIIFSKDNPFRLHGLLQTIKMFWSDHPNITVVYKYSNDDFFCGYLRIINEFKNVVFVSELNFNNDVRSLLTGNPILFLNDNQLFISRVKFDIYDLDKDVFNISLMLDKYTQTKTPIKHDLINYRIYDEEYFSPFRCGNIYNYSTVCNRLDNANYNDYKSMFDTFREIKIKHPITQIYDKSCLINNYRFDYSKEELNNKFLMGHRMETKPYIYLDVTSPNQSFQYYFKWSA